MKRLMNLMMIIILIYTVSVMPINTVVFGIDFSRIFAPPEETATSVSSSIKYAFTPVSKAALFINPQIYKVNLDTSKPLSKELLGQNLVATLSVTDGLGTVKTFDQKTLKIDVSQTGNRFTLSMNLAVDSLKLLHENYQFALKIDMGNDTFQDNFSVLYANAEVKPNGRSAKEFKTALAPIFFADRTNTLSIPIYTPILSGNNPYRRMIATLNKPPVSPLLSPAEGFPPVKNIWYSAGLLELRLNSLALGAYQSPSTAQIALANLLRTTASFQQDNLINKVRLTIDGGQQSKAFGGINISQEFSVDRSPMAYVALVDGGKTLWYPVAVAQEDNLTGTVSNLLSGLIQPKKLLQDNRVTAVMPSTITVKQATLVNQTLRITFNEAIQNAFGANETLTKTALEGLLLSVSSLPDVNNVELYVGETKLQTIGAVTLGDTIKRPDYINVLE